MADSKIEGTGGFVGAMERAAGAQRWILGTSLLAAEMERQAGQIRPAAAPRRVARRVTKARAWRHAPLSAALNER